MLLGAATAISGWLIFSAMRDAIRHDVQQNLTTISQLKVEQIENWLRERETDLELSATDSYAARTLATWMRSGKSADSLPLVQAQLNHFQRIYGFQSITVYDMQGRYRFGANTAGIREHDSAAKQAIARRQTVLVDFHREPDNGPTGLGIMAPLLVDGRVEGALYAALDPRRFVYPMLQQWPVSSPTGETLLCRQSGDRVLYLNDLRHRKNAALTFSLPLSDRTLAGAQALAGKRGVLDHVHDYRGKPIIGHIAAVHGTPWLMIDKIDEDEAYAAINRLGLISAGATALFICLCGLGMRLWYLRQREQFAAQQKGKALQALALRYDALSKYANDIILVTDDSGRLIQVNDRTLEIYGYTMNELIGKSMCDLRTPQAIMLQQEQLVKNADAHSLVFETEHQRHDGSSFPVEVSARLIEVEQQHYCHMVLRDISARKAAEARIQRLSKLYQALSETNQAILHVQKEDELFALICRCAVELGGMKLAWIGQLDQASGRITPVTRYGSGLEYLHDLTLSWRADKPEGRGPSGTALRENRFIIVNDYAGSSMTAAWQAQAAECGLGSAASFPIARQGRPFAVFNVYHAQVGAFDTEVVNLLAEMAGDISFALDNFDRETERTQAELARREAEEELRLNSQVFEASREGIVITDAENRMLAVNPAFTAITGYSREEVIGRNPSLLKSGRQDNHFYRAMWQSLLKQGYWHGELWNRRKNGDIYPEWLSISTVRDDNDRIVRHIGLLTDISVHKAAEEKILYLANHDALTKLPNRVLLQDRAQLVLASAQRMQSKVALLFVDIDRFKNINDTLGHGTGDRMLQELAARLTRHLYDNDTVCRQGGDEFILLLPDTDASGAAHVAAKILDIVAQPFSVDGKQLNLTASIGIAAYPDNGLDFERLSQCADTALFRAKLNGRNNFQFFTQQMHDQTHEALQIENALRSALANGELQLHYQPQVDAVTAQVVGAEALLRWQHPQWGMVMPGKFIPIAEESGQIREIGEWVLHTALRQNAAWQAAGLPIVPVAVNISPLQFRQPNFLDSVSDALRSSGLNPALLELELTEGIAMENQAFTIDMMDKLHALGMRLAIDDFGTGYSSLSYLKRFRIDKLKIDRSFVCGLGQDTEDNAIVIAIISLAKSLGFKVIAEGVETAEQLAWLQEWHCDEIQGYYYSRPLPPEAFALLLEKGLFE